MYPYKLQINYYSNQFSETLSTTKTQNLIVFEPSSSAQNLQRTVTVLNNQILFPVPVDRCYKGHISFFLWIYILLSVSLWN